MRLWSLLPTLAVCGLLLILGLLVLVKNTSSWFNRVFGLATLAAIGWVLANYFSSFHYVPYTLAKFLTYATMTTAGLFLLLLMLFTTLFVTTPTKRRRRYLAILTIVGVACSLLGGTPLVIAGISAKGEFWVNSFGTLSPIYFLYIVSYFVILLVVLILGWRRSRGLQRSRARLLLASLFLSIGISVITNLVAPIISTNFSLVPYGPFSIIFMIAGFSYAIVKQRLFDIRLIVVRSMAYVLLLATLAVIYGLLIFGASQLLFSQATVGTVQNLTYIALGIVLAFTFQPLRRFFERLTQRLFYRDHYDSQQALNQLSTILALELDLSRILRSSLNLICQSLNIEFGQFMIFKDKRIHRIEHYGVLPERLLVAPRLRKLNRPILVADELPDGERKEIMLTHGIWLSAALRTHDEVVGFLLLGQKLGGNIYTNQDIEFIQIAAKELAVAISNARAYDEIREFNTTLQDRVNQATSRLRVANRHLKELDQAKDEFISMASHQLRTPLTTIKGYLSMILEGDAGRVRTEQRQFVQYAFDGSERMVSLISDLLNVSRLSAGRFMIEKGPTDITAMVEEEIRQLTSHAASKGLALTFVKPKTKVPMVELDGTKTRQVIMNFIDNAVYYTQKGGVTVTLNYGEGKIRVEVTDTGIGVPEEARKHLFSKFYRAGNAQKVRPDGTGLGLYLAKRVVEDQGGTIIFTTKEGHGSTFGFELPVKEVTATAAKRLAPSSGQKVAVHAG